jgi:hypothetical protein
VSPETKAAPVTSPSRPTDVAGFADLRFLADLARGMHWDARTGRDGHAGSDGNRMREQIAAGTFDALVWVMGATSIAPATGSVMSDPTQQQLVLESFQAGLLRRELVEDNSQWLYLGGAIDALDFASGQRARFWWVPLPEKMRAVPPARDDYGRSLI